MAKIILGLGAGQCGLKLLADILKSQPGVQMTCEEKPLLPWKMSTGKLVGCEEIPIQLQDRFQRWSQTRHAHFYGDVSSSYLSYVEEAIQLIPDIRLICLQRPKQDIISGFCNWCDRQFRRPINNWSETLPTGWYRDPLTYSMYPKYPVSHRDIALGMYYDEYYTKANLFVQRFPDQFRLLDTEVLTHTEGVRDLLDFIGIPSSDQNLVTGNSPDALPAYLPDEVVHARWQEELSQRPPSHCVILVPFLGYIHQECDASLKALEQRGYQVRRVGGYSAIDQGRNQMATDALIDGFEETLWIDSDVAFHPDEVEKIRAHRLPIVTGIYPQKGRRALASHIRPGQPSMTFGKNGSLLEILYAGAGFMHVRREVYQQVQEQLNLPIVNDRFGHPMIPFFQPLIRKIDDGTWYLAEDYAFCHRAKKCGYQILADTTIRLWHIGTYKYGWEDAGMERSRFESFTIHFGDQDVHGLQTRPSSDLFNLRQAYPWPDTIPDVGTLCVNQTHAMLSPECVDLLHGTIDPSSELVLVIGDPLGRLARRIANFAPHATVITCHSWQESRTVTDTNITSETVDRLEAIPRTPALFYHENWSYRDRIFTIPCDLNTAIQCICESHVSPEKIIIDSDSFESFTRWQNVFRLITEAFPHVVIAGTGWDREEIQQELCKVTEVTQRAMESREITWRISGTSVHPAKSATVQEALNGGNTLPHSAEN